MGLSRPPSSKATGLLCLSRSLQRAEDQKARVSISSLISKRLVHREAPGQARRDHRHAANGWTGTDAHVCAPHIPCTRACMHQSGLQACLHAGRPCLCSGHLRGSKGPMPPALRARAPQAGGWHTVRERPARRRGLPRCLCCEQLFRAARAPQGRFVLLPLATGGSLILF